jgi:hypothetical protein
VTRRKGLTKAGREAIRARFKPDAVMDRAFELGLMSSCAMNPTGNRYHFTTPYGKTFHATGGGQAIAFLDAFEAGVRTAKHQPGDTAHNQTEVDHDTESP